MSNFATMFQAVHVLIDLNLFDALQEIGVLKGLEKSREDEIKF